MNARRRPRDLVLVLAAATLVLAACGATPGASRSLETTTQAPTVPTVVPTTSPTQEPSVAESYEIDGTIVDLREWDSPGQSCNDTQVVIRNEDSAILGTGTAVVDDSRSPGCWYVYTIPGLPMASFYAIEYLDGRETVVSFSDLEDEGWELFVSIPKDG